MPEKLATDHSDGELARVHDLLRDLYDAIKGEAHAAGDCVEDQLAYYDAVDAVAGYFGEPNPIAEA